MARIDLRKDLKQLYAPSAKVVAEVDVPRFNFLMIDGAGNPNNSQSYREAVEALFSVSYTAKFMIRKAEAPVDYAVMPLEGLWWADDMTKFSVDDKAAWKWTLMIMQPDFVTVQVIDAALEAVHRKKQLPGLARLRAEIFTEGYCAQVLHVGPFSEEGPTVERLHSHIDAKSALRGRHHEIYLSDIRKADPSRWRTVVRQPMVHPPAA